MNRVMIAAVLGSLAVALCGCQSTTPRRAAALPVEQEAFWSSLEALCGKAFEGKVVEDSTGNPDFARRPLVMHVRRCESGRILVPFHVADNRSRTWVFTREAGGLRLKHDHRHEDGAEEELTQYGGDTKDAGSGVTQRFHADAQTAEMLPAAATNIWTVEIVPGEMYAYMLQRVGTDRRFRVEFDLTRPVAAPPAPWGHEGN